MAYFNKEPFNGNLTNSLMNLRLSSKFIQIREWGTPMKVKVSLIILTILFGSTTLVFYNKVYVNKAGMDKGIHDMLVNSALFFENEHYDADYVEPLYILSGYAEMQYLYMGMTTDSEIYTVARIVKKFVDLTYMRNYQLNKVENSALFTTTSQ